MSASARASAAERHSGSACTPTNRRYTRREYVMRHVGLTFIALFVLLSLGAIAGRQVVPPFTSHTDLIEVDAVVTDRDGDPVKTLQRGDFSVEEDGHPVAVSTFAEIDADRAASAGDGRFVVVLLDPRFIPATSVARMIVDRMAPHDVMAILSLSGSAGRTTTGKAAALEQLEQLERGARGQRIAARRRPLRGDVAQPEPCDDCSQRAVNPNSVGAGRVIVPGVGVPVSLAPTTSGGAASVLTTIADVANQLRSLHRRKTLVYLGNASALELSSAKGMTGPWFDAVRNASRADVSVSVIDPNGTTGRPYDGARGFARETGGEAFVNRNDCEGAVHRLWTDTGHYYVLGYTPPGAKKRRHSIRVRVDRPDVDVRARQTRE
jgi:VWFA-related protein